MIEKSDPIYYTLLWKNTKTGEVEEDSKSYVAHNQKAIDDHITNLNLVSEEHIQYEAKLIVSETA